MFLRYRLAARCQLGLRRTIDDAIGQHLCGYSLQYIHGLYISLPYVVMDYIVMAPLPTPLASTCYRHVYRHVSRNVYKHAQGEVQDGAGGAAPGHISDGNILVMATYQVWPHISYGHILVMATYQLWPHVSAGGAAPLGQHIAAAEKKRAPGRAYAHVRTQVCAIPNILVMATC